MHMRYCIYRFTLGEQYNSIQTRYNTTPRYSFKVKGHSIYKGYLFLPTSSVWESAIENIRTLTIIGCLCKASTTNARLDCPCYSNDKYIYPDKNIVSVRPSFFSTRLHRKEVSIFRPYITFLCNCY